ncbi:MAG: GNAT family N-acetyltransferase [Dysosmobacter sp.]
MCSVAEIFSTFACGPVGQLEDFYVEPVFRRRGVARQLVQAAQALCWGAEHRQPDGMLRTL